VSRCAPRAYVFRRPGRRPGVPVRRKRRGAPTAGRPQAPRAPLLHGASCAGAPRLPVRPKRVCAASPPRAGVSGRHQCRCARATCAQSSNARPRARRRAPPPCAAEPVRPACRCHCGPRVRVPPSAHASSSTLPSAPPRIQVRRCAPCNGAPRAPLHPCVRCVDARVLSCARHTGALFRLVYRCARALRGGDGRGGIAASTLAVLGLCAISPPLPWRCRCDRCTPLTTHFSAPPSSSRCSADTRR